MYFRIKVGPFQLWVHSPIKTLYRVESAPEREEYPDISYNKES